MENKNFEQLSYEKHSKHFAKYSKEGERAGVASSWFNGGTLIEEAIKERNAISDPLLNYYPGAKWITVGDGRFGTDAAYLISKGADALATDISEFLLKEGKEKGLIKEFAVVNAEKIPFDDDAFDFTLCKESYHHFPRPMKALYEMLRVSKKGVLVMEPVDQYMYNNFFQMFFRKAIDLLDKLMIFKILLGRRIEKHTYEEVGNYVFKVSIREMEKVALGLSYRILAYKSINFMHVAGMENTGVK